MTDYTSLKRLAEYHINLHGDTWHAEESRALESLPTFSSEWFVAAASPKAVLGLIAENERLTTLRSKTERELVQELEVWRHGPSCWSCGDTGDVHDMVGEWRGQCDCLAAKLIDASSEREQLKAEVEALRKALTDVRESVQREYWDEYAGLEETRAILDAVICKEAK